MRDIYKEEKWKDFEILVRDVVGTMQDARIALDVIQDAIKIDMGAEITSSIFHRQAHNYPKLFDKFSDILKMQMLNTVYPGTSEYTATIETLDDAINQTLELMEKVDIALSKFIKHGGQFAYSEAMASGAKKLLRKHGESRTPFLELRIMWRNLTLGMEDSIKVVALGDIDAWVATKLNSDFD